MILLFRVFTRLHFPSRGIVQVFYVVPYVPIKMYGLALYAKLIVIRMIDYDAVLIMLLSYRHTMRWYDVERSKYASNP